jgi:pimeloyl-ACP methyl ester carboxylesterase
MLQRALNFILPVLPANIAFQIIRVLSGLPTRVPLKERDKKALAQGKRIELGSHHRRVAWTWGNGPLVIFVHGWGGRGTQMAALAQHVAAQGFQSVIFDVTAHGAADGRRVTFEDFISDVADLSRHLDKTIYAYVGHSVGALCMMAAREIKGIRAEHYVCICAPRGPYLPINIIRKALSNLSDAVLEKCKNFYSRQLHSSWGRLDDGYAFEYTNQGRLLLIYDENDDQVAHTDGDRIKAVWPEAKLVKTRGLGHHRVLWNQGVITEVSTFLRSS